MPDIGAISAGISSIKVAIDIAKELKGATSAIKDAEVKLKIAELLLAMADVKIQLVEAQDENLELKQTIKELESALSKQDEVVFRDGYYYLSEPQDGKPDGPFCSNCYTTKNLVSLLTEVTGTFRRFGKYECPSCEQRFGK
ncbi:hypothetical protein H5079_04170 [Pseudoalteromonas sp. SG44-5]|uniref:hypothetical protein n=1 Tax=Pseudoalteromonas sp. SG44-5 TaxID=2760960 RepID=UPI0015FC6B17|nr:hypothetical protein [Pseudoalteromonas sp. SG44-5]MBB1404806.1 hypothetical protein [Pseudoalteromonas sp. SG44-5]